MKKKKNHFICSFVSLSLSLSLLRVVGSPGGNDLNHLQCAKFK